MDHKEIYLLWGIVPVTFDKAGAWQVNSKSLICRMFLTSFSVLLLKVNVTVESLLDKVAECCGTEPMEMRVPVVPISRSFFGRIFRSDGDYSLKC